MSGPLSLGILCFPGLGGSSVVASELAVGLARRGHRVHLLASERPSRSLPEGDRLPFHAISVPDYPLFQHAPYTLAAASKIVDVCRDHRLDLVQAHYAVPHAASLLLARDVLGAEGPAIVCSLHGTDVTTVGASPAYRPVTAHAVAAADGITVPSDFLRREARARLGLPEDRAIEVMHNFVDTERFTPAERPDRSRFSGLFELEEDGPVLVHVSNFRPVKRVCDLIEVLARVRKQVPARLVLVGEGPDHGRAEELAVALGVAGSTCFLGRRLDFVDYLRNADAFLMTSECESFGVAALEALAAGVPVFAYRVGGLPEVVTEDVGRLVEPRDVDALAAAIVDVLARPNAHAGLRRAARDRAVTHFRCEPALDRYETWFRKILTDRLRRRQDSR